VGIDAQTVAQIVGGVGASASAVYAGWRWLKGSKLADAVRNAAAAGETHDTMTRQVLPALDRVLHELQPNSGGSLRDAVTRIDHRVGSLQAKQRALDDDRLYFESDAAGAWEWVSQATARALGRATGSLIGYGWINAVAPDERAAVRAEIQLALDERRELYHPVRMIRGDGSMLAIQLHMIPISHDGNGRHHPPTGFLGLLRAPGAITDRHPSVA
jgi:PAS domain S-box-containing protein